MVPKRGIDIAWATPSVPQIKATGAEWVARYFSTDSTKDLTAAEVRAYLAAGLGIVTVWETTTGRATAGHAAGVADAQAAEAQRKAVGLPADHVHHFAVDEDTSWASVAPYFDGAISVLGLARVGAYGGVRVIEGAHGHGIRYLWQTVAWSGGIWAPYATIRQPGGTALSGGADYDEAEVPDFGQTPRPAAPKPPPPTPKPAPHPEADMPLFTVTQTGLSGVSFPRGSARTVGFFTDNTLIGGPTDPGATLRVVVWSDAHGPEIHQVNVTSKGSKQTVVAFKDPASTHSVTVTRTDTGKPYPVFAEVS